MPTGICRAEAKSNSEKIKPIALAVSKLRLPEDIRNLPPLHPFSLSNCSAQKWQFVDSMSVASCVTYVLLHVKINQ